MDLTENLSLLLLRTRQEQGLSREELAGLAQISTSFIRDAEKSADNCSYGKLIRLMTALGIKWFIPTNPALEAIQLWNALTPEDNAIVNRFAKSLLDQRKSLERTQ